MAKKTKAERAHRDLFDAQVLILGLLDMVVFDDPAYVIRADKARDVVAATVSALLDKYPQWKAEFATEVPHAQA